MSNIFHKIEHGIEHAAKDVGDAVEGVATQKVAEAIVDVITNPEVDEAVAIVTEVTV